MINLFNPFIQILRRSPTGRVIIFVIFAYMFWKALTDQEKDDNGA